MLDVQLNAHFPDFKLAIDVNIPTSGVTALFGASGSGKTTTLRAIAGLTQLTNSCVRFNGEIWQSNRTQKKHSQKTPTQRIDSRDYLPTHQRQIGYVFQQPNLFPHLNVQGNLAFGCPSFKQTKTQRQLDDLVEMLDIGHLLKRRVQQLSGGEQQRVAIARTLLTNPRLLLMDEPLSALDQKRKNEVLPYLQRLTQELATPIIYVTHSLNEVVKLAHNIVLFEQGRVNYSGSIAEAWPRLQNINGSEEPSAVLELSLVEHCHDGLTLLQSQSVELLHGQIEQTVGSRVRCQIMASDVSISLSHRDQSSILNRLPATIVQLCPSAKLGEVLVSLRLEDNQRIYALLTQRSCDFLQLMNNMQVWIQIKTLAIV
ncbi:molybdenum ABC transporter ATP-binding protein [Vibrio hippocampi]|uniref:Sulfate/thiosulfate import ATP-binding protein CysA n=1 Tax=Vibrio hippocampi TaxID=654686 RepID=A0ABM8ZN58_9VIBR|nr:molybdenum ABC transporter ATP-binding protein [Vibrio hippocampi]CAH0529325.1 Sulfate/thiosulfate import ATP-binding protein CysA [Vibrio hippocampi]